MRFPRLRRGSSGMDKPTRAEILWHRAEVERDIAALLRKVGSDFTLEDVKDVIYNEEEQDDLAQIIAMFDTGQDAAELDNILDLTTDAWNSFPHKMLGGLSPDELLGRSR